MKGWILRLRKVRRSHTGVEEEAPTEDPHGVPCEFLPRDPVRYMNDVLAEELESDRFVFNAEILASESFIATFTPLLLSARDSGRRPLKRSGDVLDTAFGRVVLMHDATLLRPLCVYDAAACAVELCVELKPKAGIPLQDAAACRFCMHQTVKALEAQKLSAVETHTDSAPPLDAASVAAVASLVSPYCPLRLYSSDEQTVERAVTDMMSSPQNNFRLFVGGDLVFPPPGGDDASSASTGSSLRALEATLAPLLAPVWAPSGAHAAAGALPACGALARVVCAVLREDGALGRLAAMQARGDGRAAAAGAWDTYKRVADWLLRGSDGELGSPSDAPAGPPATDEVARYAALAPRVEAALASAVAGSACGDEADRSFLRDAAASLRSFMIGTTAKDCSLMIAMRLYMSRDGADHDNLDFSLITRQTGFDYAIRVLPVAVGGGVTLQVEYRVVAVDLDPKPLARVPHYARLEETLRATHAAYGQAIFAAAGKSCLLVDSG